MEAASPATDRDAWRLPIDAAQPAGDDLAHSALFDALAEMRRADDPLLDQGDWVHEPKRADDAGVMADCDDALRHRSKDLRLAGWWTEAAGRQQGAAGLARGLARLAVLMGAWPQALHPQDEERRAGALSWLLLRLPEWLQAAGPPPDAAARALHEAFRDFERALATPGLLGAEPLAGEVAARLAVERAVAAAARPAAAETAAPPEPPIHASSAAAAMPGADLASIPPPVALPDRDAAIRQLQAVAHWFRVHEPHSPVGYLAARAADWAAMPLHLWLRSVVKDAGSLAVLEELLAVPPERR